MYGFKILCEISKVPFEISHKILNPYTAKYALPGVKNLTTYDFLESYSLNETGPLNVFLSGVLKMTTEETSEIDITDPLWVEPTDNRSISFPKRLLCRKGVNGMTPSWYQLFQGIHYNVAMSEDQFRLRRTNIVVPPSEMLTMNLNCLFNITPWHSALYRSHHSLISILARATVLQSIWCFIYFRLWILMFPFLLFLNIQPRQ